MDFTGTWYIYRMEMWDEHYFNMEVQAFIKVDETNNGEFQFGLVEGGFHGRVVEDYNGKRFEFMWNGCDECDPASGTGWIRLVKKDQIEGEFIFDPADRSKFWARKAK